jgi:hypothetical protein
MATEAPEDRPGRKFWGIGVQVPRGITGQWLMALSMQHGSWNLPNDCGKTGGNPDGWFR